MSLCAPCREVIDKHLPWHVYLGGAMYRTIQAIHGRAPEIFLRSAIDGCHICSRIFHELSKHHQSQLRGLEGPLPRNKEYSACQRANHDAGPPPSESHGGSPVVFLGYNIYEEQFRVCFWFGGGPPCAHFSSVMLNVTWNPTSGVLPSWSMTSRSTASEETFSKIVKWLSTCHSQHMQCIYHRERLAKGWYPTRLLRIDSFNCQKGQDPKVRIVRGDQLSAGSLYATLSHVWGRNNTARLTVDNKSLWERRIPVKALPQTFLDAIRVANRLGINYLWIDSLCIIQEGDESRDWEREAPTMQNVYSNAAFNICASWAPEIGGLFTTRDPTIVQHAPIELRSKNGYKKDFLLAGSGFGIKTSWYFMVDDSPLACRGWVFQERMLAPRNIFFCKEMVLYECYEQRWSESRGIDVMKWDPTLGHNAQMHNSFSSNIKEFLPTTTLTSDRGIYRTWYELVEKYHDTELTVETDRLAAVAGIAQRYSTFLEKDVYVAGLWLSRLSLDMLWQGAIGLPLQDNTSPIQRPKYLTFSWIWYRDGGLDMLKKNVEGESYDKYILPQVTCVKWRACADTGAEEYLFSEDIFMLPSTPSFEIMVKGHLKRMRLRDNDQDLFVVPVGVIAVPELALDLGALILDEKKRAEEEDEWSVYASLDHGGGKTDIADLNNSGRLFYVPWFGKDDQEWGTLESSYYCLLLELLPGEMREMGRFRRIGLLEFGQSPELHELYFSSQVDEEDFPCWKYDQETGEHTFFIV